MPENTLITFSVFFFRFFVFMGLLKRAFSNQPFCAPTLCRPSTKEPFRTKSAMALWKLQCFATAIVSDYAYQFIAVFPRKKHRIFRDSAVVSYDRRSDLPSRPKLLQKTSLHKSFLEAINSVIVTKTFCIQQKQIRERPQRYYKNKCFRELYCNNFGQDGTMDATVCYP